MWVTGVETPSLINRCDNLQYLSPLDSDVECKRACTALHVHTVHCSNCHDAMFLFVCRLVVAGATNVHHRMDYDRVCTHLWLKLVCLLRAEATDETSYSTEGAHGSRAICHCTPGRWVHVLCSNDPGSHPVWTVWRLSALSLVWWVCHIVYIYKL